MKQIIITIIIGTLLFTACGKHKHHEEQIDTQTVMVYIAGDNNLQSFIIDDVEQMMEGSKTLAADCNLLLFVDKRGEKPYYLKVENGDTVRVRTCEQELKTSDAETMKSALKWVMQKYEARSYGLVLWGHADGWVIWQDKATSRPRNAYGLDKTGGEQWMNIPEMASALESICRSNPLRFIFADCCCFQSVESAYELRHCADYIIASAAEIPGEGAPYQTVIPALFSQRDDFYQLAADAYFQQVSYGYKEPLAVVKTSEMENLANITKTVLKQSLQPLSGSEGYPDVNGLIYYYDQTLFDMNDFMLRHAQTDLYTQWKRVFDTAVPYKTFATVWMANHVPYLSYRTADSFRDFELTEERFCGVSMFVPQNSSIELKQRENETISQMQWYKAAGLNELGW